MMFLHVRYIKPGIIQRESSSRQNESEQKIGSSSCFIQLWAAKWNRIRVGEFRSQAKLWPQIFAGFLSNENTEYFFPLLVVVTAAVTSYSSNYPHLIHLLSLSPRVYSLPPLRDAFQGLRESMAFPHQGKRVYIVCLALLSACVVSLGPLTLTLPPPLESFTPALRKQGKRRKGMVSKIVCGTTFPWFMRLMPCGKMKLWGAVRMKLVANVKRVY